MAGKDNLDLVVIGGGAAGLVGSIAAGALGAQVALIEKHRLGGECSWTGCVPSKALIASAHVAHQLDRASEFGLTSMPPTTLETTRGVLDRVRQTVNKAAGLSGAGPLLKNYGVEILYGCARLETPHLVRVDERSLSARHILIATGSSPTRPDIPGLAEAGYLTNQELFDLDAVPARLAVIGGGPIGVEMGQAFARLGSRVTILQSRPRILPRDDAELADMLTARLITDGLAIETGARVVRVEADGETKTVTAERNGTLLTVEVDAILVAAGRRPNTKGLGLEAIGVEVAWDGIVVDRKLRTAVRNIWACGDVRAGGHRFSHIAEAEAKTVVRNALLPFAGKVDHQNAPWATFTDPELAHLGSTEEELRTTGVDYRVYRHPFVHDDRAITDGEDYGVVKLLTTRRGRLLGAHILGPRAGDLINELSLAMRKGLSIADIGLTVHVYPTLGMAVQRATDPWFAEQIAVPWVSRVLRFLVRRV